MGVGAPTAAIGINMANYTAFFDTLSFSFPFDGNMRPTIEMYDFEWRAHLEDMFRRITGFRVSIETKIGRKRNNFDNHATFAGGFIAWGGNNTVYNKEGLPETRPERVQIYFDSEGCRKLYDNNAIQHLHDWMKSAEGRITRIDAAIDFMEGEITLKEVEAAYLNGDFTRTAKPAASHVRKFDDSGETFYVGNRANGKTIRFYEKGKQLGDTASEWVRAELEIHRKHREVSLNALLRPGDLFASGYAYCKELVERFNVPTATDCEKLIQNTKVKTAKVLDHLIRHARRSYGQVIYALHEGLIQAGHSPASTYSLIVRWLGRVVAPSDTLLRQHLPKNLLQDSVLLLPQYSAA